MISIGWAGVIVLGGGCTGVGMLVMLVNEAMRVRVVLASKYRPC